MSEWQELRFEEVFLIPLRNGLNKPTKVRGSGLPMVNMKEIFGFDVIDDQTPMELVPIKDKERKALLKYNDLLFARQSLVESGAGKIAIFKGKKETVFESHLIRCRINPKVAIPDFVYYLFKSPIGRGTVSTIVYQTAAAGIRGSDLAQLEFSFPPLEAQQAITAVLASLDNKIDLLHRQNKTLEALAQTLFRHHFIDGANDNWKNGLLGDIVNLKRGYDLPNRNRTEGKVPIYSSSGISGTHNIAKVQPPGIVTGRYGTIGQVFLVRTPFWPLNTTLYVQDFKGTHELFLYCCLKQVNWEQFNDKSAVPGVNRNHAHELEIGIPPKELIKTFGDLVTPFFDKIFKNEQQIHILEKLRDTLLPKLMSGEVRVRVP